VGQVYTTLQRLHRDGLVDVAGEPDAEGRIAYALTDAGRIEAASWFANPVDKSSDPRDELSIKLALGVGMPGVDVAAVIQTQRAATLRQLQDYTRLKRQADDADDLAWELVLERLIFSGESQVRWLDHVESRVRRASSPQTPAVTSVDADQVRS
jgi:DNA-binding PadR family transcriptional regulator